MKRDTESPPRVNHILPVGEGFQSSFSCIVPALALQVINSRSCKLLEHNDLTQSCKIRLPPCPYCFPDPFAIRGSTAAPYNVSPPFFALSAGSNYVVISTNNVLERI